MAAHRKSIIVRLLINIHTMHSFRTANTVKIFRIPEPVSISPTMSSTKKIALFHRLLNRDSPHARLSPITQNGMLEKRLGTYGFLSTFEYILTNRGSESGDPESLETGVNCI